MIGKSHIKIALGISLVTANPSFVIGTVFGSLLPDSDKRNTILGKYNPLLRFKHIRKRIHHRGFTHSIIGTISFVLVSRVFFDMTSTLGILLGLISHLIADSYSVRGIQLYWLPHQSEKERREKRVVNGHIKTGGLLEWIISTSIFVTGLLLLIRSKIYV